MKKLLILVQNFLTAYILLEKNSKNNSTGKRQKKNRLLYVFAIVLNKRTSLLFKYLNKKNKQLKTDLWYVLLPRPGKYILFCFSQDHVKAWTISHWQISTEISYFAYASLDSLRFSRAIVLTSVYNEPFNCPEKEQFAHFICWWTVFIFPAEHISNIVWFVEYTNVICKQVEKSLFPLMTAVSFYGCSTLLAFYLSLVAISAWKWISPWTV